MSTGIFLPFPPIWKWAFPPLPTAIPQRRIYLCRTVFTFYAYLLLFPADVNRIPFQRDHQVVGQLCFIDEMYRGAAGVL